MRIAIFSDVHGNLTTLETVLEDIQGQAVDEVVFAGDLCLFGPRPAECLRKVQELGIAGVYGNTDEWIHETPPLAQNVSEEMRQRQMRTHAMIEWTRAQLSVEEMAWLNAYPFQLRNSPTVNPRDDLLIVHANPQDVNQLIFPPEAEQLERFGKIRQSDEELDKLLVP